MSTLIRKSGPAQVLLAVWIALAFSLGGRPVVASTPANTSAGPAVDAGDVRVVSALDRTEPLSEGDSNTVFSVELPEGAECPGDSANDDWRVQTFVVPVGTDLATLRYGATRPRGDYMYGLYTTEGSPYVQVLTAQNPGPGEPGLILDPPALSFAVFTPDLLPVGTYVVGVACSYFDAGAKYWDARIVLSEASEVQPGERRWVVVGAEPAESSTSDRGWLAPVASASAAAAVALGALALLRRHRHPTVTAGKERSR